MTGPLGIYQRARASSPKLGQGSSADDVARAVIVDEGAESTITWLTATK